MVKIIADSTCDLSEDLLKKYDIDITPLFIRLGDEEFEDGSQITPDEIYQWSDANKSTPKTAACSMEKTADMFKAYVDQGMEVICFSISEQMSTTANVMRLAAADIEAEDKVTVIDSANLSTGGGLLVIEAAILAKEGKSAAQITAYIESIKPLVRASFVVDTLTYLHRGGRCSGMTALMGSTLKIHPEIIVENGAMTPSKKYRGKMEKVLLSYVADLDDALKTAKPDRVFITHSGCSEEIIALIKEHLESLDHFKEILITRAGGVISSHCGPGTLGVLFIAGK